MILTANDSDDDNKTTELGDEDVYDMDDHDFFLTKLMRLTSFQVPFIEKHAHVHHLQLVRKIGLRQLVLNLLLLIFATL